MGREETVEVDILVTRIVLSGNDPERFIELLKFIKAGLELSSNQRAWASAMLSELKEESWR